jgi:hypothetical protein
MKHILLAGLLTVSAAALVTAQQEQAPRAAGAGPRAAGEAVSVTGPLSIAEGMIAIRQDDTTYYLRGIERFVGFIDGLKEGAEVTIQGVSFQRRNDNTRRVLVPATMTLNGKTYDIAPARAGFERAGFDEERFGFGPDARRRIIKRRLRPAY